MGEITWYHLKIRCFMQIYIAKVTFVLKSKGKHFQPVTLTVTCVYVQDQSLVFLEETSKYHLSTSSKINKDKFITAGKNLTKQKKRVIQTDSQTSNRQKEKNADTQCFKL